MNGSEPRARHVSFVRGRLSVDLVDGRTILVPLSWYPRLLQASPDQRERWELFLVTFSATHRGGHKLWDLGGVKDPVEPREREELTEALRQVYRACDDAVGRLLEHAGPDVITLVYSLHGMGPNNCRTELLPEMLSRVLAGDAGDELPGADQSPPGLAKRLRDLVPEAWRDGIKRRLPVAVQDRLTAFWRMGGIDWSSTRAASLVADLQGYVRINLRGRESAGIVEPGDEYDRLCDEIAEGLTSFVDPETGGSVVADVMRSDSVYPAGPRRDDLPDLIVRWSEEPVALQRAVASPRFGTIVWPVPGKNPDGRSGNHRPEGFLIAAGGPFREGAAIDGAHILDLAPTIYNLCRIARPDHMKGRVLV